MSYTTKFLEEFKTKHAGEPEFVQSVDEVVGSLESVLTERQDLVEANVLQRITEPERTISFRVVWTDDNNVPQVNRGYRVQFSSALGPYKGGLRFHPTVTQSVLKFLGFEQIFKNSLTGLWLGGGKGGSDFDPKGKSDAEVMRFCQAFMTSLVNYIGPDTDIPAGDIGVGAREIGYLFGWYKRLAGQFHGALTGKGADWGGSDLRPEATGYGLVYFVRAMLEEAGQKIEGHTVAISGSGNVAQYAAAKIISYGGKVITMSDSGGYIHDPEGLSEEKLAFISDLKNNQRGRIEEYAKKYSSSTYHADRKPWDEEAAIYLPCATQNEVDEAAAKTIAGHKPIAIAEGANMPCTPEAIRVFQKAGLMYAPGKATNAGGVAVSGLEMAQNSARLPWTYEQVDARLQSIMAEIHAKCLEHGQTAGGVDYVTGANVAGFLRVADAMLAQGVV